MKIYDLVIFDCDGTLVNSEPITNRVVAEMMVEKGIPMTLERSVELFAGTKFYKIAQYIDDRTGPIDYAETEREFRARCKVVLEKEIEPIEGITEILDVLSVPFCVASNGPREKMEVTLEAAGIMHHFIGDRIFSAYDIQVWKPQPDLFLYAVEQMNGTKQSALVIEDTISGVMGAINAGIDVWAFCPKGDPEIATLGIPIYGDMKELKSDLLTRL